MDKEKETGYVFPIDAFPSTLTDEHKFPDSQRVKFLKTVLPVLVEKISSKDPRASLGSLKVELEEFLKIFREIFESNNAEEMNVLRLFVRQLGISGVARALTVIANCKEIGEDMRNQMKKLVLDETRK